MFGCTVKLFTFRFSFLYEYMNYMKLLLNLSQSLCSLCLPHSPYFLLAANYIKAALAASRALESSCLVKQNKIPFPIFLLTCCGCVSARVRRIIRDPLEALFCLDLLQRPMCCMRATLCYVVRNLLDWHGLLFWCCSRVYIIQTTCCWDSLKRQNSKETMKQPLLWHVHKNGWKEHSMISWLTFQGDLYEIQPVLCNTQKNTDCIALAWNSLGGNNWPQKSNTSP